MATAPPHRDRLGLELTAASGEAARAFDDTVWAYVGFSREPGVPLKRALQADPAMPMALCLQGYFMHLMGLPGLVAKARTAHEAAAKTVSITDREKLHVAALGAWCDGELESACGIFEEVLRDHPRDFLALKLSNYLYFYMGDAAGVRDGPARALQHWDEGTPGYGHLLALHAFGLEESGDYAAAERSGRRATEINPADPWAVHSVAHVMEMQNRAREGVQWIESLAPHWDQANFFRFHLWWHLALLHWGEGRMDEALRLYDARVWGEGSSENLSLTNDISMLARLEIAGAELGKRWDAAAEVVRAQSGGSVLAFVDAHYALALGEVPGLQREGTTGRVHGAVGKAACEAAVAWRRKDHARVVEQLAPARKDLWRLGGSHAQRDLFTLILLDSAIKTGRQSLAEALRAERGALRPGARLPPELTLVKE
ncbi:MAG: tetratricopeptide repeat protein [Candidatus Parcubacteria bacterium]|nr:tetratricopeptide repeat protein [Burkholderiales bacterium]